MTTSLSELHELLASIYRRFPGRPVSAAAHAEAERLWCEVERLEVGEPG